MVGQRSAVPRGALPPLLSFISGGSDVSGNWILEITGNILDFRGVALILTTVSACAALFAALIRILLVYATARFSSSIGFELGEEVFRRRVEQPYEQQITQD